jgi:hypothetical protein
MYAPSSDARSRQDAVESGPGGGSNAGKDRWNPQLRLLEHASVPRATLISANEVRPALLENLAQKSQTLSVGAPIDTFTGGNFDVEVVIRMHAEQPGKRVDLLWRERRFGGKFDGEPSKTTLPDAIFGAVNNCGDFVVANVERRDTAVLMLQETLGFPIDMGKDRPVMAAIAFVLVAGKIAEVVAQDGRGVRMEMADQNAAQQMLSTAYGIAVVHFDDHITGGDVIGSGNLLALGGDHPDFFGRVSRPDWNSV